MIFNREIHLFPINNPSLDTGPIFATATGTVTAVACQKNTANDRVANSCHRNNTTYYYYSQTKITKHIKQYQKTIQFCTQ